MKERTLELVLANQKLAEKDQRISEDLAEAEAFQRRILPALPRSSEVVFAAVYRPADAVGGDLYDVCEIEPGRFRVFIADTTGHGVQAWLRTMVLKTEYDRIKQGASDPGAVLSRLSSTLYRLYPGLEMRCSACCFDIDVRQPGDAVVRYANAAHPPLLHVTKARVQEVYQPGPFLGMVDEILLLPHVFKVRPGDRLVTYTDGICEQEDGRGNAFGLTRIGQALALPEQDLDAAVDVLIQEFVTFACSQRIEDDIALVAAELVEGT